MKTMLELIREYVHLLLPHRHNSRPNRAMPTPSAELSGTHSLQFEDFLRRIPPDFLWFCPSDSSELTSCSGEAFCDFATHPRPEYDHRAAFDYLVDRSLPALGFLYRWRHRPSASWRFIKDHPSLPSRPRELFRLSRRVAVSLRDPDRFFRFVGARKTVLFAPVDVQGPLLPRPAIVTPRSLAAFIPDTGCMPTRIKTLFMRCGFALSHNEVVWAFLAHADHVAVHSNHPEVTAEDESEYARLAADAHKMWRGRAAQFLRDAKRCDVMLVVSRDYSGEDMRARVSFKHVAELLGERTPNAWNWREMRLFQEARTLHPDREDLGRFLVAMFELLGECRRIVCADSPIVDRVQLEQISDLVANL